jgi:hypothetical protein
MHLMRSFYLFYYRNNFSSKKYISRALRCPGIRLGSGYGIIRRLMALLCLHSTHRRTVAMSLRPQPIGSIPEQTALLRMPPFPKAIPI